MRAAFSEDFSTATPPRKISIMKSVAKTSAFLTIIAAILIGIFYFGFGRPLPLEDEEQNVVDERSFAGHKKGEEFLEKLFCLPQQMRQVIC